MKDIFKVQVNVWLAVGCLLLQVIFASYFMGRKDAEIRQLTSELVRMNQMLNQK